jgi:hypothetical protein
MLNRPASKSSRASSVSASVLASALAWLFGALGAAGTTGCRASSADEETGQIGAEIGEVMSSVDESADGGATTALMWRTPLELRGPSWRGVLASLLPSANAATCGDTAFGACTAGVRTRSFNDCSIGLARLAGSAALSFSKNPLCVMVAAGDTVTRTANFTLTGLYGGTLAVTSPGGGQTLGKTATGFAYTVGGLERVLTGPAGRQIFDVSTRTTTPLEITGTSRADRVIVSGALEITHHLAGYKVTLVPDHLAWASGCTCAVSGSLTGTLSGGKHDGKSATVTLTGCGEASITIAGQTDSITLDRCMAI